MEAQTNENTHSVKWQKEHSTENQKTSILALALSLICRVT